MAGTDDFRARLLALIDAASGALDRNDSPAAARCYAEASELLFQRVPACIRLAEKVDLTRRAQQFLATAAALRGERPAAAGSPAESALPAGGEPLPDRPKTGVTFADIAGLEDVKETLRMRVIYPLRSPEKLAQYGLKMGGGMLLYGPPGTGKTMVAKAVAGELELPFFSVTPSQVLSQYYGESEKQLAAVFDQARQCDRGSVIFIDEIDAIGASRRREGTSEPARRLLNQLLQELDGVHGRPAGLLFLAATNEPWLLDEALLRPPRFSEKCYLPLPDAAARAALFGILLRDCQLDKGIDFDSWSTRTEGYSGADLMNLCERAKMIPYREAVLRGIDRALSEGDLKQAIEHVRPSVSAENVAKYATWASEGR